MPTAEKAPKPIFANRFRLSSDAARKHKHQRCTGDSGPMRPSAARK